MTRTALLAGSFNPPTLGHLDLIERASHLCDPLLVAIAVKPDKKSLFTYEERREMLLAAIKHRPQIKAPIEIVHFQGLLVDFAKEKGVAFLIRGIRTFSDFELEFQMAMANRKMGGIETLFLMADGRYAQISSSLIREIAHFGGPLHDFVPPEILPFLQKNP